MQSIRTECAIARELPRRGLRRRRRPKPAFGSPSGRRRRAGRLSDRVPFSLSTPLLSLPSSLRATCTLYSTHKHSSKRAEFVWLIASTSEVVPRP